MQISTETESGLALQLSKALTGDLVASGNLSTLIIRSKTPNQHSTMVADLLITHLTHQPNQHIALQLLSSCYYYRVPGDYRKAKALGKRLSLDTMASLESDQLSYRDSKNIAVDLFERAIALGNEPAVTFRAVHHYYQGDIDICSQMLDNAIAKGNIYAVYTKHSISLLSGDVANALILLEQLVEKNIPGALVAKAKILTESQYAICDYATAIMLYEKAIAQDDILAMCNRADMHIKGLDGPVNFHAAFELCQRIIALGYPESIWDFKSEEFTVFYHNKKRAQFQSILVDMIMHPTNAWIIDDNFVDNLLNHEDSTAIIVKFPPELLEKIAVLLSSNIQNAVPNWESQYKLLVIHAHM
ncbi:MAG: hypothetical protein M3R00_03565, partial [Pseudomonadota bacterium]|nr:hypothetical protein [Pseudomonadota bacterium]